MIDADPNSRICSAISAFGRRLGTNRSRRARMRDGPPAWRPIVSSSERALEFPPAPCLSLLVVFDYLGWSHMRLIWITSGVPQSLTLPQQIPALI